jgi:hypothetical protein
LEEGRLITAWGRWGFLEEMFFELYLKSKRKKSIQAGEQQK